MFLTRKSPLVIMYYKMSHSNKVYLYEIANMKLQSNANKYVWNSFPVLESSETKQNKKVALWH